MPDLSRSFIPTSMLTLLVCFCEYLEQLFSNGDRLALMTNHPPALDGTINTISLASRVASDWRGLRTSEVLPPITWSLNIFFTQNLILLFSLKIPMLTREKIIGPEGSGAIPKLG